MIKNDYYVIDRIAYIKIVHRDNTITWGKMDEADLEHPLLANKTIFITSTSKYRSAGYMAVLVDGKIVKIHRILLATELTGTQNYVDHINRDSLDDCRTNLRVCSAHENSYNAGPKKTNKLSVRGVYKRGSKFVANISINNKTKYLGSFNTLKEAALAYNDYAKSIRGHFAYINEEYGF